MQTKYKVIIVVVSLATAFAVGRFTTPVKVKTETKIVEVDSSKKTSKDDEHKKTTITETDNKDGSKTITTVVTDDRSTNTSEVDNTNKSSDTLKEVTRGSSQVTISILGGTNVTNPAALDYGLSATKPILGPITVGLFGFRSGLVGGSVGLTF